jgi:hypothetical protein
MKPPSLIGRVTFLVHLVIAAVTGFGLLLAPSEFGALFGWPASPIEVLPIFRNFGAVMLGLGAVTSLYGLMTKSWDRVDYIVRAEISFLALQFLVFLIALLMGTGPAAGNLVFTLVALVLLVLFILTWVTRPK